MPARVRAGISLTVTILRRGEARAALRAFGLTVTAERFLDLPFYEHGPYRQF